MGNIRIGDAELDLLQGLFQRGTEVIPLTKLEQDFLVYLAINAGRPIPSNELLGAVWHQSPDSDYRGNQIKSIVKRLRHKLEPDPQQPRYLLNRRGHGYYVPKN